MNTGGSAITFRLDDVSVWDTAARSPSQPNPANVPSSVTVFDARGKVIESVGAPRSQATRPRSQPRHTTTWAASRV